MKRPLQGPKKNFLLDRENYHKSSMRLKVPATRPHVGKEKKVK